MKRVLPFVAVFLMLLVPSMGAAQGEKDMVAGTAHFDQFAPRVDVHVNATSGPNGEDARGWWRYDQSDGGAFDLVGEVTCLNVTGNSALLSGVITEGAQAGTFFLQFVQDAGSPGSDGDNSVTLSTGLPTDPGCRAQFPGGIPATGGNYVVKDAA